MEAIKAKFMQFHPKRLIIGKSRAKRKPAENQGVYNFRNPIDYDSFINKIWDMVVSICLIALCFTLPFFLAYLNDLPKGAVIFNEITDIIFIIDIPLHFLTTMDTEKGVVDDFWLVAKKYVFGLWFFVDVASVIPPGAFGDSRKFGFLKVIKLLRINKLMKLLPKIQAHWEIKNSYISISKFTMFILLAGHWSGCFFYFIAKMAEFPSNSWVRVYQDGFAAGEGTQAYQKFITSLYWAITMMSTIGFGDLCPGTNSEIVYCLLVSLLGVAVFAYSVTNMCAVVFGMNVEGGQFACLQDRMKHLLEKKNISTKLKKSIRKYLLYKFHVSSVPMFGGFKSLDNLSDHLKEDVLDMFCKRSFNSINVLNLFGPGFVRSISFHLEGQVYNQEEVIMLAGTYCNRIFMVATGKVELIYDMKVMDKRHPAAKKKSLPVMRSPTESKIRSPSASTRRKASVALLKNKLSKSKDVNRPRLAAPWDDITSISAKRIKLQEGISFNEVGCLLSRQASLTVFSIKYVDIYSVTRKAYLDVVAKYFPDDMPKLFQRVIRHANAIGDLDFSLNKDSHDGEGQYELPIPEECEFNAETTDLKKLQILRRNMQLQEKIKREARKKVSRDTWDLDQKPDTNFKDRWEDREGFATTPIPLSERPAQTCHGVPRKYEGKSVADILLGYEHVPSPEDIEKAVTNLRAKISMLDKAIDKENGILQGVIDSISPPSDGNKNQENKKNERTRESEGDLTSIVQAV